MTPKLHGFIFLACFSAFLVFSCNDDRSNNGQCFKEAKPSFFDLRHGSILKNKWIRQPENLRMIHETFKKFGYEYLLNESICDDESFFYKNVYIRKNFSHWVDSLVLSRQYDDFEEKYYREFWQRRKKEQNDSVVFCILKEIQDFKNQTHTSTFDDLIVNDTLYDLLMIEFGRDPLTTPVAEQNFNKLVQYGFHQSAYNLLYERYEYYDIPLNRDILRQRLVKADSCRRAWLADNTK